MKVFVTVLLLLMLNVTSLYAGKKFCKLGKLNDVEVVKVTAQGIQIKHAHGTAVITDRELSAQEQDLLAAELATYRSLKSRISEYILSHNEQNPRNSEGAFVKLKDGTLYFAYTRYNGKSWEDHATADIAAVVSKDNGKSWSEPFIVINGQQKNIMSVSLLRLNDGRIAMTYLEKSPIPAWDGFWDCRQKIVFSTDETATWSTPVEIANIPPAYLVVCNDRLIQLKSGRLVLPAAHHEYARKNSVGNGVIKFFISDDNGASWRISKSNIYPPYTTMPRGLMEPGVIELKNGTLVCFIRTAMLCQYKSFSYDHGESWTVPIPAREFSSPESPMSIKRNPLNGKLYAVWNACNPLYNVRIENIKWLRTPLIMAESDNEGASWKNFRILEDAPDHAYCYIAMYFNGDLLHLGYCCGGEPDCETALQNTKLSTIKL